MFQSFCIWGFWGCIYQGWGSRLHYQSLKWSRQYEEIQTSLINILFIEVVTNNIIIKRPQFISNMKTNLSIESLG